MEGGFYASVLARSGIEVITPTIAEREYVHDTYMTELVAGRFDAPVRDEFLRIIRGLKDREAIDGVVLAGTELPLLLRGATVDGVEMLDTTALHVAAIVDRML